MGAAASRCLVGREDDVLHAVAGKRDGGIDIAGGLGEPHGFWFASESVFEVGDSPQNLGVAVPGVAEWQDCVAVSLGNGTAVTVVQLATGTVGVDDGLVCCWGSCL